MSSPPFPDVRLVAVAITRGPEFLTVFNPNWRAFTLPMTRRQTWSDPRVPASDHEEKPSVAAVRAAAEALGRPLAPHELPRPVELAELQPFQQSDRDGVWKSYRFDVFCLEVAAGEAPAPVGGGPAAWLTLDDLRAFQPVSPTAVRIAEAVHASAVLRGE